MELRQLRYFSAVAREGTYTAAAERLHVAQPALWRQVQELERELGVALFERVGRRVRITAAGSLLLDRVEPALVGADRISELADALRHGRTGRVRVGCFAPHIVSYLAPVVAEVRREHPSIAVELIEFGASGPGALQVRGSLVDSLRSGATDAITTSEIAAADDLDGFPAYEVHVVAVPPPVGEWAVGARRRRLSIDALRDTPLVVSPRGYFSRERLQAACRMGGFEPRIEVECTSPAALLALAEAGVGTAVVASDAVTDRRALPLTADGQPLNDVVWLYHRVGQRDPALDLFLTIAGRTPLRA